MRLRRLKILFLIIVCVLCYFVICLSRLTNKVVAKQTRLLVNTPGCKIPNIDPFDISIRSLISRFPPLNCSSSAKVTYTDGAWLRINSSALLEYADDLQNCMYESIIRVNDTDNGFVYKEAVYFTDDVLMKDDFLRVACYAKQGGMFYVNFHAFILERGPTTSSKHLNVLALGVDSISRLNFIRQMPQTRNYLQKHLKSYEMKGFNKVADNTYVNIVPMLTGNGQC